MTLWLVVGHVLPPSPGTAAAIIRAGIVSWFAVDSLASIAAGAPVNALLNIGFVVAFFWPVMMEAVRRTGRLRTGDVELSWRAGQTSAVDAAEIANARDVGTITAVDMPQSGAGRQLPYDVTFAFVAHAFHPDIPVAKE